MRQAVQRARERSSGTVIDVESRPHARPVNLGVEWGSRGEEFCGSLRDFLTGPRPGKAARGADAEALRVDFVEHRLPLRGFLASCAWHLLAVWLLILPIWGFLPSVEPTLQTPNIQVTWYAPPAELPKILLPSSALKSLHQSRKLTLAVKSAPAPATETYHPRQSILSVPVRATHPRQTLIQPKAPLEPPKLAPALPNMVQWAASAPPQLQLQIPASKATPKIVRRWIESASAPQITEAQERVKLDLIATQAPKKLAMPLSSSNEVAAKRAMRKMAQAPAPEISESHGSDPNVRQIIALSAAPVLAAPKVTVPEGNLAARIAMSPNGRKSKAAGSGAGNASAVDSAMKGGGRLPAAIRIGEPMARTRRGGPDAGNFRRELGLTPFSRSQARSLRPSAPARIDVAKISPSLPPESVFSGRQVYTMNISMPNVTSASGSWILNFAELDTGDDTPLYRMGVLSGPEPLVKVDPKYPPDLIREHVQGEVVLYAIIRKNGTVDSIRVMRSLDPRLDREAEKALAQWKFRPGTRAGVPVDIEAVVHIPFNYASPAQ